MEKELISVILPVWKPIISQLKKCVESLICQTYSNNEIIIVYKKSLEHDQKFFELVESFSNSSIKIIIDKNTSFPAALNEGIQNSSGEFIARIDADDFCEKHRFEKQLEFKEKNDCNVVGSWAYDVTIDGKKIGKRIKPVTHQAIRKKMMWRCPILHPTVLMDRKMLDEIGFYDPSYISAEDYELWFRAMHHNYKFGNVPEFLVNIGIAETPDSITRGSGWKKARVAALRVKNKALLHYGFCTPKDIFYYIPTPFYYLISPHLAMKVRKNLKRN